MNTLKNLFKKDKDKKPAEQAKATTPQAGKAQQSPDQPLQLEKLTKDDFEVFEQLGKGSFAQVVLARRISNGKIYALKVVTKQGLLDHKRVGDVFTERNVLIRSSSPFLLKLHNTFQSPHKLYFVMDYMPGGDLDKYLNNQPHKAVDLKTSKLYAAEVYLALIYLHQHAVIYRDLKPENILMTGDGHCVLADFGLSKDFHQEGQDDEDAALKAHSFVGSPFYVSPDVLKQKEYSTAVDWWSFGILLYRMLCGRPPFSGRNMKDVFDNIMFTELRFPSSIPVPDDAKDLISQCLIKDANKRIKGEEIGKHSFWNDISFDDVNALKIVPPNWTPMPSVEELVAQKMSGESAVPITTKANNVVATPIDASALAAQQQKLFTGFSCTSGGAL